MARYYLCQTAAPYVPAAFRGAWDKTSNCVTRKLSTDKAADGGTNTALTVITTTTNGLDEALYRGVSGPLAAGTIAGTLDLCVRVKESGTSLDLSYHVHLWVTQGDSDTSRGTLLADYVEAVATDEWPTGNVGVRIAAPQALSPVAAQAGDRLVLEVGYHQASANSGTATLSYGGTAADITDGGLSNLTPWADVPDPVAPPVRNQAVWVGA